MQLVVVVVVVRFVVAVVFVVGLTYRRPSGQRTGWGHVGPYWPQAMFNHVGPRWSHLGPMLALHGPFA